MTSPSIPFPRNFPAKLGSPRWLLYCFCLLIQGWFPAVAAVPLEPKQPCSFTISCAKSNWLLGEPVLLRLSFRNTSATPQEVTTVLRPGTHAYYFVSCDGSGFVGIEPQSYPDTGRSPATLAPGDTFCHEECLAFDARGGHLVFAKAGRYSLRVAVDGQESNVLAIGVVQPESALDRAWVGTFLTGEVAFAAAYGGRLTSDTSAKLAVCAGSRSVFAPYAAFLLAKRTTNGTEAEELFGKADVPGFPLRSQALYGRGAHLLRLGRHWQAMEQLKRVVTEFPDSAAAWKVRSGGLLSLKPPAAPPPPPQEPFNKIVQQLEAQGYDWKGFMREVSPEALEYRRKELEIFDAYSQLGTPPDAYKKIGELLESYVRKYVRPVPAEELKGRYEATAKQEAAELARRQAEETGRIPEVQKPPREKAGKPVPK
jgi:hypothetical protein